MKKGMKRFLSVALALSMGLSNSVAAFATTESDVSDVLNVPADAVAQNAKTLAAYDDVNEALEAAVHGETVMLLGNEDVFQVFVPEDITLDLNGYTLNAEYVMCFGNIIDSSQEKTGLLSVPTSYMLMQKSNTQLPVKNGDGYQFFEVTKFNFAYKQEESKYVFQPFIDKLAQKFTAQEIIKANSAADAEELQRKPLYRELLKARVFSRTVVIRREGGERQYLAEEL